MQEQASIRFYSTPAFISEFIPAVEMNPFLKPGYADFMIMRVEDMYRHVHHAVPPTRSSTHILLFFTEGRADMSVDNHSYTLLPGQMLTIAAGQVIAFEAWNPGIFNKGFICIFSNQFFAGLLAQNDLQQQLDFLRIYSSPFVDIPAHRQADIRHLFTRLTQEYLQTGLQHQSLLQAYLFSLLQEIKAVYPPQQSPRLTASANITQQFLEKLSQLIRQEHRVAEYAAMLHVSPNHLNKAVKAVTGKSPAGWIDDTLILEAQVLLSQSNAGISQVATAIGIWDASYFTRLFKKKTGLTPGGYRKKIELS